MCLSATPFITDRSKTLGERMCDAMTPLPIEISNMLCIQWQCRLVLAAIFLIHLTGSARGQNSECGSASSDAACRSHWSKFIAMCQRVLKPIGLKCGIFVGRFCHGPQKDTLLNSDSITTKVVECVWKERKYWPLAQNSHISLGDDTLQGWWEDLSLCHSFVGRRTCFVQVSVRNIRYSGRRWWTRGPVQWVPGGNVC